MQTGVKAEPLAILHEIRASVGRIDTPGLSDDEIARFLTHDKTLSLAIEEASVRFRSMAQEYPELYLDSDETHLITTLQKGFVNFFIHLSLFHTSFFSDL